MGNSIEIVPVKGRYVVRIMEDGATTENVFGEEAHARSWASGQNLRLANTLDLATDDLAKAYSKTTSAVHSATGKAG